MNAAIPHRPGEHWERWTAAALGAIVAVAWVGSSFLERSELESRIEDLRYEFEFKQSRSLNLDALKLQLREIEAHLADVTRRLPSRFDPAQVDRDLTELASEHDVDFLQVVRGEPVRKEFYAERGVELALRGAPGEVYGFLDELMQRGSVHTIRALDLRATSDDGMALQARLRVNHYRYVEDGEELGDTDGSAP